MRKRKLKKKVKRILKSFAVLIIIAVIFIIISNKTTYSSQEPNLEPKQEEKVINYNIVNKNIYLVKDEEYKIDHDYSDYSINDSSILSFDNNTIKGLKSGNTSIEIISNDNKYIYTINVSDLLNTPSINNSKPYLSCHAYTEEQAKTIDEYLTYHIDEKGYNTRAGAVEAARFLTLMFPYKLKYFFENGRLDRSNSFFDYVDGEGRYYHKGLYLTDNKFNDLVATLRGPQPWGCSMYNDTTKTQNPNGLDCSGFITWALVNAGYDPGDVGAGPNGYNDITDIGIIVYFNDPNAFNNVKVGDLIGRQGHIAMLIGYDGNKYYVAEALDAGEYDMHVYSYTKDELINSQFKYFVDLDNFYKQDGKLNNMW
ncbi:MAG: hypothetical protein K5666_03340 [Bacilli bacterium]|nr:hypothetical protein [Bacilli bacterium]